MKRFSLVFLLAVLPSPLVAGGEIRLPMLPAVPTPPAPSPQVVSKLSADQLYVVDGDVPFLALTSPPGLIKVTSDVGPIKVRGRFADGKGVETRTYKGKQVTTLEAVGTGKCEVLIVPLQAQTEADVIRRMLDVDDGTKPIPPPDPPKPPDPPTPNPAPIPVDGFRVLILYESADQTKMPAAQQSILFSKTVRDYLNSHCAAGPKVKDWRIWDKDVDPSGEAKLWQDVMKRPRVGVPWIVVSNGKSGFEGPLPANVGDTMALLKKYGGE